MLRFHRWLGVSLLFLREQRWGDMLGVDRLSCHIAKQVEVGGALGNFLLLPRAG